MKIVRNSLKCRLQFLIRVFLNGRDLLYPVEDIGKHFKADCEAEVHRGFTSSKLTWGDKPTQKLFIGTVVNQTTPNPTLIMKIQIENVSEVNQ